MLQANPLDIRMDGVLFRDGPVVQMGSHHFPVQRFWNGMEGSNRLNSANQGRIRKILRKIYLGAQLITISHDITRYYNILLRIMHRATGPTIGLHPRETFEIKDSVTCGKIPRDEKNSPKISSIKDYNSTMNSTWWFHNIYIYIYIYHNIS